jgi:pyruvate dehydrogenase E1 component alpha subunit/2-oxoisovalerate dehydrogenase E1 component alpha subunit
LDAPQSRGGRSPEQEKEIAGSPRAESGDWSAYIQQTEEEKALGLYQFLNETGQPRAPVPPALSRELCRKLYAGMLRIRIVDDRLMKLQRQGRIGFYGEALGQEAAVVGSAAALEPEDWLVPSLREAGAGLYRGLPLASYVAQIYGTANDVSKGRQLPCHPCDKNTNYVVMSSCVSSQIPHAVGIAMAMKICGDKGRVCMGYMGDGGTSEEDFHVAMNFAGVTRAPVVLVCQNNQWAISTPGNLQTISETIAVKGLAYGLESLRVDGNDVLGTYLACRYATDKARRGDGATFVELLTYRVSAHSSSDDPSRYRDESVTKVWKEKRDPLARMVHFLKAQGFMTDAEDEELKKKLNDEINQVVEAEERAKMPAIATLIEDVFERPTWRLQEDLAEWFGQHGVTSDGE